VRIRETKPFLCKWLIYPVFIEEMILKDTYFVYFSSEADFWQIELQTSLP